MKNSLKTAIRVLKLLCRCRAHILILVYDTELTEKIFQKKVTQNYLARFGYAADTGVLDFLNQIAAKIAGGESFPHEIGIILGYPPEDIEGFKRYKGRNFKCCGYWKDLRQRRTRAKNV